MTIISGFCESYISQLANISEVDVNYFLLKTLCILQCGLTEEEPSLKQPITSVSQLCV